MTEHTHQVLVSSFLFQGLREETVHEIINTLHVEYVTFAKSDTIFSPHKYERKIGFVANGECYISHPNSAQNIPINIIKTGDSFGVTTLFSSQTEFPTLITAKTLCSILFIDSQELISIMKRFPAISFNLIKFLTRRIEFLNDRIAAFSAGSVEDKLINYIIGLHKKLNATEFDFNKKLSADAISCGRASLYRAMNSLSATGYVTFDNKKIYINDLTGLERMLK